MALNQDWFKNWDKQGKHEFLNFCKNAVNTSDTSPEFLRKECVLDIHTAIYNVIWSGVKGVIKKDAVVSTFMELKTYHKNVSSIILDIINMIDAETSAVDSLSDYRSNLAYIVKNSEQIFSDKLLKERLEIDSLQEMKVLSNRNFYTKFIKVKTKLYYKQRKFNLFREESEGYAKLITELNQDFSHCPDSSSLLEIIKSLIGCFNLDPNRVLDVMVDALEQRPDQADFFIPLIQKYMPDPTIICEVLAFKLSFYLTEPVPRSLYTVIALMLQHGIIALDDIYGWLTPDDRVICKEWDREMKDASDYVRKLNIVSTKSEVEKTDPSEETGNDYDKYDMNQKFRLCEALLELGDWNTCEALCGRLPNFCVLDQPPIAKTLCKLLHYLIEPVYRKYSGLGSEVPGRTFPFPASRLTPSPAHTFLELRTSVIPMLLALGPSLQYDLVLVSKLIRVLRSSLEQAKVEVNSPPPACDSLYYDTISVLDVVILPTLSYVDANCCLADQVWTIVKLYPYQTRYALYNSWKNETYQQHAKLLRRKGDILKKIKSVMKRVTKETIKPTGRQIGKLTHSSPGFLFDYMLLQIQTYDNLIVPVVDALKYLTCMSYDVLCYCIVETLANAEKDRHKHDGISLSLWLQSLSTFCGCLFRKYTTDLTGILQFLANQLKQQKSFDLLVLNEIVQKMAGIEAADEMTTEQMEAMAGGDLLKGEAGYFSQVRNTKRSSQRLKEALTDDLAVALCLLMAQQRYCIIYRETENTHLKLVGKLYDQCQDTLVQFGTFLGSVLSIEDYINKLPSIHLLLSEYHIHMDVAFFLARPMFNHVINQKYEALRKADSGKKVVKAVRYCEAVAEVMSSVAASVRPLHPPKVWEDISPQFLTTFWSLSMSDLTVPVQAYDREIAKVRLLQQTATSSKELNTSKQKKEVERFAALIEKLQDEKRKQQDHVDRVMIRLKQEKDVWFLSRSARSAKNETITQLLQLCLFPRCLFTCVDALYCAKFVHILHSLQTANFSTLLCYDRLFCDITYSVTSCTENEANRYGRFLCSMLETVMRWHSKKEIFDEECASYPGFVTKFRVSNQFSESNDNVGYENYRHVCHKWHYKITKAIIVCLESQDYVQIRNSLLILIRILPHFPVLTKLAQCIEKKIEKIKEEEKNKRQDLFVLATSYSGQLKARASFIMRESDFHLVQQVKAEVAPQPPVNVSSSSSKQVNGELRQDKEKPSSTIPEMKKESVSKEKRLNRDTVPPSNKPVAEVTKKESIPVKINKEKAREKEQLEREKQQRKEERLEARREEARREETKKRAAEDKALEERERSSSSRDEKHRDERYTEMPLSKDEEVVTRGSYYGYYPSQMADSQLSSVSTSSSGSLRKTPDNDRESKRRKMEASITSKKHEERKISTTTLDNPSSSTEKPEKKERREKLKKSVRLDEEKELKKERKLNRKRERLDEALLTEQKRIKSDEKVSSKMSSSHQNGDHGEPHIREKRQMQKEKSPYVRERSHDRDGRDKHRRSGETKRR